MSHCDFPDCILLGVYDEEVCNEQNEDESFDVLLCREHYIYLMKYNGEEPDLFDEEELQ